MARVEDSEFGSEKVATDLAGFGFETSGDVWLERLRHAEARPPLGTIGPYELVEEVSRGGQGVVYKARQPGTKRPIAIKRLLAGSFATASMRRRFEREIEAAATLAHPNVVTVYGVETVGGGERVLAMQWIEGVPVNRWVVRPAGTRHTVREILSVFLTICDAVQHAHQRGVIHRDLKPSNILVDADGEPHVLDFGLAKRLTVDGPPEYAPTVTTSFAGTPAYAAPEQVREGQAIDVRADVYALGVILYEMLAGRRPYEPGRSIAETVRAIEETEPPPPSRHTRKLSRELDTVVLKALAKEKERRYSSVENLADDLRRFLAGEAILAHPPSAWYRTKKLVRRRWLPLGFAATVLVLLGSVAVLQTLHARKLVDESRKRQAVLSYLMEDMFQAADPRRGSPELRVVDFLDRAASQVDERFRDQPDLKPLVHEYIGSAYGSFGQNEKAEAHLRIALAGFVELGNDAVEDLENTKSALGEILLRLGSFDESEVLLRSVVESRRARLGHEHVGAGSLHQLANTLRLQGRFEEARGLEGESLELNTRLHGAESAAVSKNVRVLGLIALSLRQYSEAEACFLQALEIRRKVGGPRSYLVMTSLQDLGRLFQTLGDLEKAEGFFRESLDIRREIMGSDNSTIRIALGDLGSVRLEIGDLEGAEELLYEAVVFRKEAQARNGLPASRNLSLIAELIRRRGENAMAEELFGKALDTLYERVGARGERRGVVPALNLQKIAGLWTSLARAMSAQPGKFAAAEVYANEALRVQREESGAASADRAATLELVADLARQRGDLERSECCAAEALAIRRAAVGREHPDESGDDPADRRAVLDID